MPKKWQYKEYINSLNKQEFLITIPLLKAPTREEKCGNDVVKAEINFFFGPEDSPLADKLMFYSLNIESSGIPAPPVKLK